MPGFGRKSPVGPKAAGDERPVLAILCVLVGAKPAGEQRFREARGATVVAAKHTFAVASAVIRPSYSWERFLASIGRMHRRPV